MAAAAVWMFRVTSMPGLVTGLKAVTAIPVDEICRWRLMVSRDFSRFPCVSISLFNRFTITPECISGKKIEHTTKMPPCTAMSAASSIYLIGAQCTGKTTLLKALTSSIKSKHPSVSFSTVTEVARDVLRQHYFTREDITTNPDRALQLQQLILNAQYEQESKLGQITILSDRSGVDPIAYGMQYGPPRAQRLLEKSLEWQFLRERMKKSLVIVCPPHKKWSIDDGTRLMASSWEEWHNMHLTFVEILHENDIPFYVIPMSVVDINERVEFVLNLWRMY